MLRILKRILVGILITAAALTAALFASIFIDGALGSRRLDAVTNLTLPGQNGGPDVRAYVARPQGSGPFPAVILIHEFYGLNQSLIGKAEGLAQEGYLVVAPDTFRGSTTSWIPRAIYQVVTSKPEQVNQDLDTVYAWLAAQTDVAAGRVGIAGFCYGGRTSLVYSLHNPRLAATVVFYGSPVTDVNALKKLPGPVLGIFGGADQSIPVSEVQAFEAALQQANIPGEITIYEGQPHAFVTDIEAVRAGGVQGQAWQQMLTFLQKNLKDGSSLQPGSTPAGYAALFNWRYYFMLAYEHAFGTAAHMH